MYDENILPNPRSESAFSGTSHTRNPNLPLELESRAYLIRATGKLRFDLWKPSLEKRSGVTFENGKLYQIAGTVNGKRFASRHVSGGGMHLYVFADGGAGVAPGKTCRLVVEVLGEKKRFAVVAGRHGAKVNLSEPALRGLGVPTGESCVVELRVVARNGATRRVYVRWDPLLGFMELPVSRLGIGEEGEVEVVGGRRYDVGAFVEDFRHHRLHELQNVELVVEGGAPKVVVDGRGVPAEGHWLTTHGLKAALRMKLANGHREMKLVFDGSSMEARLGNSDRILEWSAVGSGVDVRYSRVAGQAYVMRLEPRTWPGTPLDLDWLAGGIRIFERPGLPQGRYLLRMTEAVRESTRRKLNETGDDSAYVRLRGDIGEGIVKLLLPEMRMQLLYDHPWSEVSAKNGSLRIGPDLMAICQESGLVVYLEVKWWEDIVRAFGAGRNQVVEYFRKLRSIKGRNVGGAYIAVLDWRLTESAALWVERVA